MVDTFEEKAVNHVLYSSFYTFSLRGARCSSVVRAFTHGAMGRWIDPSWWTHSERKL